MTGFADSSGLRAMDWVEVRSKPEILATLDTDGSLEGLPFMPEMFAYCGKRFQVFRRAHKTCDPPNGLSGRRMPHAVHLDDVRCNGEAHGHCQARCLIFWKEAWLKRAGGGSEKRSGESAQSEGVTNYVTTEEDVVKGTRCATASRAECPLYSCQSTQLQQATVQLSSWDWRQYLEDYTSGNVRLSQLAGSFFFFLFTQLAAAGLGFGSLLRWSYDAIQKQRKAAPFPMRTGQLPSGTRTPSARLNLQPGELVRIRSYPEILATLDENGRNRGIWFDAEMVPYCGGTYRVLDRVNRIINEKTGKMQFLKNDCIMLETVVCRACYSKHRRFCPRSIYPYWREIWLERVEPVPSPVEKAQAHCEVQRS